jgi:hypothetical protein
MLYNHVATMERLRVCYCPKNKKKPCRPLFWGCSHNQPYQRTTTVGKNPKTTDISILKPSKNYTEMSAVSCICSSLSCPRMTEMSTWSRAPGGSSSTLIPPYSTRTTCLNAESCGKCVGERHLLPFGTADCESTPGLRIMCAYCPTPDFSPL